MSVKNALIKNQQKQYYTHIFINEIQTTSDWKEWEKKQISTFIFRPHWSVRKKLSNVQRSKNLFLYKSGGKQILGALRARPSNFHNAFSLNSWRHATK